MASNKRSGGWTVSIVAVTAGVLASGMLVWSASNAAFSGTTTNPNNSWQAGTVALTDDDSGTAMFVSQTGLTPNSADMVNCIVVNYTGNVTTAAPVRLYAGALGGTGLATYLNLTVEIGTAVSDGVFGDCDEGTDFAASGTIYSGLMSVFAGYTAFGSAGVSTGWTPTGAGGAPDTRVFRITVDPVDNNAAQTLNCTLPFIWEAQA